MSRAVTCAAEGEGEVIRTNERTRRSEITLATNCVRMMVLHGKHGLGRTVEGLKTTEKLGCDVVEL